MKPIFITLLILQIFLAAVSLGQTAFHGRIIDSDEHSVAFATVRLFDKNKSRIAVTSSFDDGSFTFMVSQSNMNRAGFLFASYLSAISDTLRIDQSVPALVIKLAKPINVLHEVGIIEKRQTVISRGADRLIFKPGEKMVAGAATIDILKLAPYVEFDQKSERFSVVGKEGTTVNACREYQKHRNYYQSGE